MRTKIKEFHRRSKNEDLRKSDFSILGGVLEASFGSTMLQEVGILPTLINFYLRVVQRSFGFSPNHGTDLRGCLALFSTLKPVKGSFGLFSNSL